MHKNIERSPHSFTNVKAVDNSPSVSDGTAAANAIKLKHNNILIFIFFFNVCYLRANAANVWLIKLKSVAIRRKEEKTNSNGLSVCNAAELSCVVSSQKAIVEL